MVTLGKCVSNKGMSCALDPPNGGRSAFDGSLNSTPTSFPSGFSNSFIFATYFTLNDGSNTQKKVYSKDAVILPFVCKEVAHQEMVLREFRTASNKIHIGRIRKVDHIHVLEPEPVRILRFVRSSGPGYQYAQLLVRELIRDRPSTVSMARRHPSLFPLFHSAFANTSDPVPWRKGRNHRGFPNAGATRVPGPRR